MKMKPELYFFQVYRLILLGRITILPEHVHFMKETH